MREATKLLDGIIRILLIEDEEFDVRRVRSTLRPFEQQIQIRDVVANGDTALELLRGRKDQYDVVVMDLQIAGGVMGESLIREIRRISSSLQIIVITKKTVNVTDYEFANKLLQAGAFWYCTKYPTDIEEYIYQPTDFIISIVNAYQRRTLERAKSKTERKLVQNVAAQLARVKILGVSQPIQKLRAQIGQLFATDATVLITGASGTGKELVANNIHYTSKRKLENLVTVNCGSIPADLVESELFGYEKGAFTGASTPKPGLFELADHGTLFLDEISELPQSAQVKILRVLQEGEIEKIGRTERLKVDVRIIAATNKVLQHEVKSGRFREDLYYRLNVVPLFIPPIKDRPEDILVLWDHFMQEMSIEMGRPVPVTDHQATELIRNYEWPGNVRELKNVVQRLLLREESAITPGIVREAIPLNPSFTMPQSETIIIFPNDSDQSLKEMETHFRRKYFEFVRTHSASDAEAARKLGLAPPNFHRMCKELGLKE